MTHDFEGQVGHCFSGLIRPEFDSLKDKRWPRRPSPRAWRAPQASSASFSIIAPSASMPAAKQNRSKLVETSSQALPTASSSVEAKEIDVVLILFMALLSFRGISTRAYRLKASNAAPPISTCAGAIPPNADYERCTFAASSVTSRASKVAGYTWPIIASTLARLPRVRVQGSYVTIARGRQGHKTKVYYSRVASSLSFFRGLSLTLANFDRAHRLRGIRNIGSFSTIS